VRLLEKLQISLAAARVNAGMTQEDVAKEMHISKATIINWEKGKVIPRISEIQMLSRIYKIPQDNIFLPCYSTKSRK
jgi:DNA-binding XRE family transcriptional regulator